MVISQLKHFKRKKTSYLCTHYTAIQYQYFLENSKGRGVGGRTLAEGINPMVDLSLYAMAP